MGKVRIIETIYKTHKRYTPERKTWYGKWTDSFPIKGTLGCFSISSSYCSLEDAVLSISRYNNKVVEIPVVSVIYKVKKWGGK